MDEFLAPFWNLDQVFGWAETRDPEMVRAAALPRYGAPKSTMHIQVRSTHTAPLKDGRDVDGELWAASGWIPQIRRFDPPALIARHAENLGRPVYQGYLHKDLRVEEPFDAKRQKLVDTWRLAPEADREEVAIIIRELNTGEISRLDMARLQKLSARLRRDLLDLLSGPEVQGPPRVYLREPFPTLKYLEFLFQTGRLTATAQIPGYPLSVQISTADWSGLKIGVGGQHDRMSVWRAGQFKTAGEGDFENVRVARDEVLRGFPAERTEPQTAAPDEANDDEIRAVIREAVAANGGFLSQDAGAEIVRMRFPEVRRDRARDLVKQVTGNEKRGPQGPRRNSANNSAQPQ